MTEFLRLYQQKKFPDEASLKPVIEALRGLTVKDSGKEKPEEEKKVEQKKVEEKREVKPARLEPIARKLKSGDCKIVVILTGAGISVSVGIPDFRTPGTGLYSQLVKYNLPLLAEGKKSKK